MRKPAPLVLTSPASVLMSTVASLSDQSSSGGMVFGSSALAGFGGGVSSVFGSGALGSTTAGGTTGFSSPVFDAGPPGGSGVSMIGPAMAPAWFCFVFATPVGRADTNQKPTAAAQTMNNR